MASFSPQQQAFIGTYAKATGLNPGVVAAQVAAEEPVGAKSGWHGTQDWLNVGITDHGPMGAGNPAWKDPVAAANLTAQWVKGQASIPGFGSASSGIRNILSTVGQSPAAQVKAIQGSGWASSGYPGLASLYNTYGGTKGTAGAVSAPTASGSAGSLVPTTTSVFDQAAFDRAQKAAIAGQFLQASRGSVSMFDLGKGADIGPGVNLFGKGLLTTTMPSQSDYTTAQTGAQQLAGDTPLNSHPATGAAASMDQTAQKMLGKPYIYAGGHGAANLNLPGYDCSGFVSNIMEAAGVWNQAYATPSIPTAPNIKPGQGSSVTIWNNPNPGASGHVWIVINGKGYESAGGGLGSHQMSQSEMKMYLASGQYKPFHPTGL